MTKTAEMRFWQGFITIGMTLLLVLGLTYASRAGDRSVPVLPACEQHFIPQGNMEFCAPAQRQFN